MTARRSGDDSAPADTAPDPQPVNADLRDRIRNYPGDGPHQAGAGDTAPDDALAAIGADVLRDHAGRLASVAEFDEVLAFRAGKGITHSFHSSAVRDLLIECHTIRSEYDRLRSDAAALRAAVQVAAARHTADARLGHDDVRCASCPDEAWPCPTATALDAWRSAAGGES